MKSRFLPKSAKVDGFAFNSSNKIVRYGTCPTAAATAAKVATLSDSNASFSLEAGSIVFIKFTYANGVASPTLNVNGTGAKPILRYGSTAPGTNANTSWVADSVRCFVYDGTNWRLVSYGLTGNDNTVPQAYCTTAATTGAKIATCTNYALLANSFLMLSLTTANTASSALTLNVNSKGAKPIYINGSASSATNYSLPAGTYLTFYDGVNYYLRTDGKITGSITGDAATVNGHTVLSNVPANAVFTDTQTITGVKGNSESSYRTGNVNLTAANIGAAASSHTHAASGITSGTLSRDRLPGELWIDMGTLSSLPTTKTFSGIRTDMICARIELGTPSAQRSDWEINTDTEDSVTISGTISGTTTCKLLLVQAESGTAS